MSKEPTIENDRKKHRFEIILERFSLKKKWLRTELIDALQGRLDDKSVRHKRGRHVKDPIKIHDWRRSETDQTLDEHRRTSLQRFFALLWPRCVCSAGVATGGDEPAQKSH
jgi:hypothetical protein